ncbi:MAG: Acylamino-acid-releasing enzyme [Candidatus Methanolliviera sp. GoM_oil]|nr:MAG: Acylamino-acid-releasing enzyme [Candidatus Methanolliviera sp. GoM_oil]
MPTQKKHHISAEDLYKFQQIADCRISPNGRWVVFCIQRTDRKTNKNYSNLWITSTKGSETRQFTYGDHKDSQSKWSPDGTRIAFVSNRENEKQSQIYVISFDGGEARKITDLKGTIGIFEWSPDGKKLVCQFRKKDKEAVEREKDEKKKEMGIVSRHITRVFYKLDGSGFLPKERWHIWTIDAHTGKGKQLTDSDIYDEVEPQWSPDGSEIVFCSNHSGDPDLDPDAIDLFTISAKDGKLRKIETPIGPKEKPIFSPDGKWLAYFGREGRAQNWKNVSLWVIPTDGSEKTKNLTAPFDFNVSSWTINDVPGDLHMMPPTWLNDERICFQVAQHGNTTLKSIALDGKELQTIIGDSGVVGSFSFDKKQTKLVYFHGDMIDLGQIWIRDLITERSRKLTNINVLKNRDLGKIEEVWFKGAAGNDLQGWILKPPGFDENKKYPSILEIHGGPRVQYGNFFMHEFYYLAARGYVVYFCNPRGGQGYGEAHSKAILNRWGTADYEDLMAWADFVQQKPYIDTKRMGVTGGSYGGYMTNWIIGHIGRFGAAVTQRSVSNLISMYGSSDLNWSFQEEFGEEAPWDNLENYWQQSPMKYIGNVKTPTLVIHSEQDLRCPLEQDEQVFVALKKLGVDTEMVLFPNEPHGISRGGRTDRRIERLNHIVRWFDRYLK